ncbi:MAG: carbon starvation protein A, partial [Treponema sp.]|nr:carbon starvation protein A [Treponema sp.]
KTLPATIIGIVGIVVSIAVGLKFGLAMSRTTWIILIGVYIAVASLIPVWIMLQPRDYLSSFLLYAMMLVAFVGIIVSAFTGSASFEIPAFNSAKLGAMFPTLFITVACGACSGFHSLIATGTSSKQLDNERNAKAIGYGSMLIESALGIISLIAVGMVYNKWMDKGYGSPSAAFGAGIAIMFGKEGTGVYNTINALLTLAVSVFALTSLDTGTRLSRFMFSELFLKDSEKTWKDAKGVRKLLAHPLFGTSLMVVIGCILGGLSLSQIWGLFGAANQLLAGIALMAVAAWLGEVGKNNKMFFIPTIFMLAATLTFLVKKIIEKVGVVGSGKSVWGDWFQLAFAAAMAILAVILVVEGVKTFKKQAAKK